MREVSGDIFEQVADALCITTNGFVKNNGRAVMGRGVALQAARLFRSLPLTLGQSIEEFGNVTRAFRTTLGGPVLVSLPVKHNWWEPADPDLIRQSLTELVRITDETGWEKVVLPRPGCGNGQLDWKDVHPMIAPLLDARFVVVVRFSR